MGKKKKLYWWLFKTLKICPPSYGKTELKILTLKRSVSMSTRTNGFSPVFQCLIWFELCYSFPSEKTECLLSFNIRLFAKTVWSSCLWDLCKPYFFRLAALGPGVLSFFIFSHFCHSIITSFFYYYPRSKVKASEKFYLSHWAGCWSCVKTKF